MNHFIKTSAVCVLALAGGGLTTSLVYGGDNPPNTSAAPVTDKSPAPGQSRSVDATVRDKAGRQLGALVYRSKDGRKCVAVGELNGNRVGAKNKDGSFTEMPLSEGGTCVLDLDPAGYSVVHQFEQPGHPEEYRVFGLAKGKVKRLTFTKPTGAVQAVPGADGGFAAQLADGDGSTKVTAELKDGSTVALADIPGFDQLPFDRSAPTDAEANAEVAAHAAHHAGE